MTGTDDILSKVETYYTGRLRAHGATPQGVDWPDAAGQTRRFAQLTRLFEDAGGRPTVIEIGCGYGAFVDHCDAAGRAIDYVGYDVAGEMIAAARARHPARVDARFEQGSRPAMQAEYCISSGIFNVKLDVPIAAWEQYVFETIDIMAAASTRGFAFNALTSFIDPGRDNARLYYAAPGRMLDYCLARFGRSVALLHDYGMFEFTVLVRHGSPLGRAR